MKVLGITEVGAQYSKERAYIVQITHTELRKVADKAAYHDKFEELKPGEEYPIGEGHDFRKEIVDAVRQMKDAHEKFASAAATMARFASLILPRDEQEKRA